MSVRRGLSLAGALLAVNLVLCGCAGPQQRAEALDAALRRYNEGIRWQRFDDAALHVSPAERDEFLDGRDQLHEDLRIDTYEIIRVRYDQTGKRARVHLKVTWYRNSEGIVHETHTVQSWRMKGASWLVEKERFLRGEPMPGVLGDDEDEPGGAGEPAGEQTPGPEPG